MTGIRRAWQSLAAIALCLVVVVASADVPAIAAGVPTHSTASRVADGVRSDITTEVIIAMACRDDFATRLASGTGHDEGLVYLLVAKVALLERGLSCPPGHPTNAEVNDQINTALGAWKVDAQLGSSDIPCVHSFDSLDGRVRLRACARSSGSCGTSHRRHRRQASVSDPRSIGTYGTTCSPCRARRASRPDRPVPIRLARLRQSGADDRQPQ